MQLNTNNQQKGTAMKSFLFTVALVAITTLIPAMGWAQDLSSFSEAVMVKKYAGIVAQCPNGVCPSEDLVKQAKKYRALARANCNPTYGPMQPDKVVPCQTAVDASPATFTVGGGGEPVPPADPCKGVTCGSNASCRNGDCQCNAGMFGDPKVKCEAKPDPCKGVKCIANARCNGTGKCVCAKGYEGDGVTECKSKKGPATIVLTQADCDKKGPNLVLVNNECVEKPAEVANNDLEELKARISALEEWVKWIVVSLALGLLNLALIGLLFWLILRKKVELVPCPSGCKDKKTGKVVSGKPGEPCLLCKKPFPSLTKAQKAEVDGAVSAAKSELESTKGITESDLDEKLAQKLTSYSEAQALDVNGTLRAAMIQVAKTSKDPVVQQVCNGIDDALSPANPATVAESDDKGKSK